jgi:hypothetical protein
VESTQGGLTPNFAVLLALPLDAIFLSPFKAGKNLAVEAVSK